MKNTKLKRLLKPTVIITIILTSVFLICGCSNSNTNSDNIPNDATDEQAEVLYYANDYLFSLGGFSEQSLANQLDFEGFSSSEIEYALENINVDWNEQCLICAQEFMNGTSFTEKELRTMLQNEGFSESEIEYAISNIEF